MRKLALMVVWSLLMCTTCFGMEYDGAKTNEQLVTTFGNLTEKTVDIFVDNTLKFESFLVVVNDEVVDTIQPNEWGYAIAHVKNLKSATQYEYYVVGYKEGDHQLSKKTAFRTEPIGVSNQLYMSEYSVTANEISVTARIPKGVGVIDWYVDDEYRGSSFSVNVGFGKLVADTEYKITGKYTTSEGIASQDTFIRTTSGPRAIYTFTNGHYKLVQ